MNKNVIIYISIVVLIVIVLVIFGIFNIVLQNGTAVNNISQNSVSNETWLSVMFDYNNGDAVQKVLVYENGYVMEPKSPEKDGYIFKNWELNGKEFDFQTPITENIVLTAKWEENTDLEVKSYSVIFDSNGGSAVKTQHINENEMVGVPVDPVRNGYIFAGWQLDGYMYNFNSKVTDNIILKAIWQKVNVSNNNSSNNSNNNGNNNANSNSNNVGNEKITYYYTVYLNIDDGFTTIYKVVEEGKIVPKPDDPIKPGYEFVEWHLNGQKYNFDLPITNDITLTAIYEKVVKTYVITFDGNGGELSFTQKTINYGKYGEMPIATREGYMLMGWTLQKDGNTPLNEDSLIQKLEDHTLYAKWEKIN